MEVGTYEANGAYEVTGRAGEVASMEEPQTPAGGLPETGEAAADMAELTAGAAFRSQEVGTAAANAATSSSGQEAIGQTVEQDSRKPVSPEPCLSAESCQKEQEDGLLSKSHPSISDRHPES